MGKLFIVSTPIGNLQDMTFRAIDTLKSVDLIAAEDTRHTIELLNHLNIKTKVTSYHEHNKYDKAKDIIEIIKNGSDVACVTDAGTPIISDPGNELVKLAVEEGIVVTAVPGACAAINALVLSGLDAREFVFVGFLEEDNKKKKIQLERLINETRTMIFYISPHSILKDLKSLSEVFGDERNVSITREMTKMHEEIKRGKIVDIINYYEVNEIRGEFVLVVEGIDKNIIRDRNIAKWCEMTIKEHIEYYMNQGLSEKEAMKCAAKDRGIDKREVYKELKIN